MKKYNYSYKRNSRKLEKTLPWFICLLIVLVTCSLILIYKPVNSLSDLKNKNENEKTNNIFQNAMSELARKAFTNVENSEMLEKYFD